MRSHRALKGKRAKAKIGIKASLSSKTVGFTGKFLTIFMTISLVNGLLRFLTLTLVLFELSTILDKTLSFKGLFESLMPGTK